MKNLFLNMIILPAGSGLIAQAGPADTITGASQKLAGESNYSWHTTVVVPADSRYKPGPTEGKTEKDGLTYLKVSVRNNTIQLFVKGTNIVVADPDPDGGWETLADFESSDNQGPGRFLGYMARSFKLPAAQAAELAAACTNFAETNGAVTADLTPDGAKKLLSFRRGNATVSNPSGSARFWVMDGELAKFEIHVKGVVTFNDNDTTIDRDTTVEITDIGTTEIKVPNDAKKLLP